jgi:hypothetical protein
MRRQPLRVTSWWHLLEESLVSQSSRTLKSDTRISHTHNRSRNACVRRERALKSQVCCWNEQERCLARDGRVFIAHTPKTSHWEGSAHFAVRPKYNSRSDRQEGNNYFDSIFFQLLEGWRSDHPGTKAGGLTGHLWRLDHPGIGTGGLTVYLKINFFHKSFSKDFNLFKIIDHSEIFTDQGERWCSLRILTRIRNLSKVTTID